MLKKLFVVAILVVAAGAGMAVWRYTTFKSTPPGEPTQQVVYEVRPGLGFNQVALELKERGLVTDPLLFKILARLSGQAGRLKVGEYALHAGMTPSEILDVLVSGKSIEYPFTVPEGYNIFEIADLVEQKGIGTRAEFLQLARDPQFIQEVLGEALNSLEGYLYPETYQVTKFTGLRGLIKLMVGNFKDVYANLAAPAPSGFNRHQLVTLASVIEKETGAPQERPLISSVFHNRLKKGMRLQSDPTIIYGIWERTQVMPINIRKADILEPTRYNTYTVDGLPHGPIANPGRDALSAAAQPMTSSHLYFVSRNDGTHVFTDTYDEHLGAVRKFQLDRAAREGKSWRDLNAKPAATKPATGKGSRAPAKKPVRKKSQKAKRA